jgi:hypothetical protein
MSNELTKPELITHKKGGEGHNIRVLGWLRGLERGWARFMSVIASTGL